MITIPTDLQLRGHGLILRPFSEDDLPAIVELFNDAQTARWYPLRPIVDLAVAAGFLERDRRARSAGVLLRLAVTIDGRAPVGEIVLNLEARVLSGTIASAVRGQGIAKRAATLMIDYARDELSMTTLFAQADPDNTASIAVMEALGFVLTDRAPETFEHASVRLTVLTWELRT